MGEASTVEPAKVGETFEAFIERERERLNNEREAINSEREALNDKLAQVVRELEAIDAYDAAKRGVPVAARRPASNRGPRGEKRGKVLEIVKANPNGMGRADILEALGVKGDKSGEQSVSNALSAMKKGGSLVQRDKKWFAA